MGGCGDFNGEIPAPLLAETPPFVQDDGNGWVW